MSNRLSPEKAKAIAAEYLTNGLNREKALLAVGYKPKYAAKGGLKLWQNMVLTAEIARMQAKSALKTDVTVEFIVDKLLSGLALAESRNNVVAIARFLELLGRYKAMFTDNVNQNDIVAQRELDERDAAEAAEFARWRLAQKFNLLPASKVG
jgi:hypothetical protein